MPNISANYSYYDTPISMQLGNYVYRQVSDVDTRSYIDTDNVERTVHNITTPNASYKAYITQGVVNRSDKYYPKPVSRVIGGKEYKNIISNTLYPNGTKSYESASPNGIHKIITINSDGKIIGGKQTLAEYFSANAAKFLKKIRFA